jgi:DNA-binding protein
MEIHAKGKAINKAITVAEIIKQKCSNIVDQKTLIDEIILTENPNSNDPSSKSPT